MVNLSLEVKIQTSLIVMDKRKLLNYSEKYITILKKVSLILIGKEQNQEQKQFILNNKITYSIFMPWLCVNLIIRKL